MHNAYIKNMKCLFEASSNSPRNVLYILIVRPAATCQNGVLTVWSPNKDKQLNQGDIWIVAPICSVRSECRVLYSDVEATLVLPSTVATWPPNPGSSRLSRGPYGAVPGLGILPYYCYPGQPELWNGSNWSLVLGNQGWLAILDSEFAWLNLNTQSGEYIFALSDFSNNQVTD